MCPKKSAFSQTCYTRNESSSALCGLDTINNLSRNLFNKTKNWNFPNFLSKTRQNERRPALCSFDVNKVWRIFSIKPKLEFSVKNSSNLHILSKNSTLISWEKLLLEKIREIAVVLNFLAVDNFDFTKKKILGEKLVKMFGINYW